jgi:uncharacterized protein
VQTSASPTLTAPEPPQSPAPPDSTRETTLTPLTAGERMASLDVVRGLAVLGILLMNIIGFAFHVAAYVDPTVAGGAAGLNLWVYAVNAVLVDGKMRGIFSLVFGAGVIVLTSRAVERGSAAHAADIHYRRTFWLMLFGVVHAYFLWWGDILYPYALLGLLLYPVRLMSPRGLTITGAAVAALLTLAMVGDAFHAVTLHNEADELKAAAARGQPLTEEQSDAVETWEDRYRNAKPDAAEVERVNAAFRGSFGSIMAERAKLVAQFHFTPYYFPVLWDMLVMMLFGMAMMKTRVLAAERSFAYYAKLAAIAYAIGLPLSIWTVWRNVSVNFDYHAMTFNNIAYEPARIAVCLGHVGVVMMLVKAGRLKRLNGRLAAVGQMAFSNYILQSVICVIVFYGTGFALFGTLERYQAYYVVLACWLIHLTWSPWWLRRYRFGPLEWAWRSLTYWQRQPMRVVRT